MKSDTKPGRAFNAMLRSLVVTQKTVKSPPVFQESGMIQSLLGKNPGDSITEE